MSDKDKEEKGKEKKKSPVMLIVLLVVGLVGGIGFSKMTGGSSAAVAVEPAPEPGEIAALEAINVNLAGGHFLRISVGCQLTKEVTAKPAEWAKTDGTKVKDAIIEIFSGKDMTELQKPDVRKELVKELKDLAKERTEKEVIDIYLSEFVMQ